MHGSAWNNASNPWRCSMRTSGSDKSLIALALVLATINQVFSLLDPLIFRLRYRRVRNPLPGIFDRRVLPRRQPAARRGGRRRLRLARRQELSGLRHQSHHPATRRAALRRRHPAFARSALLDVRGPAERGNARQAAEGPDRRRAPDSRLDQRAVHVAGRRHFRDGVRVHRALADRAGLFRDRPAARHPQLGAEPQDQGDPETDRRRDDRPGRIDDRVAPQHRTGEEPGTGAAGDRAFECDDRQDPGPRAAKGALPEEPELHPGHRGQFPADEHPVPDALSDLRAADHRRPVLLAVHLLVLHFWTAAGTRQRHQHLPRDRGVAGELRGHPANAQGAASAPAGGGWPAAPARIRSRGIPAPDGLDACPHRHLLFGGAR